MNIKLIAEIGINHNGDLEQAKTLMKIAKDTGCDAVKFQKRTIDIVYTQDFLKEHRESPWGTTQREQKEGLEFDESDYREIDSFAKEIDIINLEKKWNHISLNHVKDWNIFKEKFISI